jgi:hypothetical protein
MHTIQVSRMDKKPESAHCNALLIPSPRENKLNGNLCNDPRHQALLLRSDANSYESFCTDEVLDNATMRLATDLQNVR